MGPLPVVARSHKSRHVAPSGGGAPAGVQHTQLSRDSTADNRPAPQAANNTRAQAGVRARVVHGRSDSKRSRNLPPPPSPARPAPCWPLMEVRKVWKIRRSSDLSVRLELLIDSEAADYATFAATPFRCCRLANMDMVRRSFSWVAIEHNEDRVTRSIPTPNDMACCHRRWRSSISDAP